MSSQRQHQRNAILMCCTVILYYGIIHVFSFSTITTTKRAALVSRRQRRPSSSSSPPSLLFLSSTTNNNDENYRRKTRPTTPSQSSSNAKQQKTLYDILNASPTDSKEQLHRKYTAMARLTHPDAQLTTKNNTTQSSPPTSLPSFPDVANAYRILSNPKTRLRYDRSLQAEAFASRASSLIDTGFSVAVPFLFETAPQTINKTASDWGRRVGMVGERMERARVVLELKMKAGELVQRAGVEVRRAKELRERREGMQSGGGGGGRGEEGGGVEGETTLSSDRGYAIIKEFDYLNDTTACLTALDALAAAEQTQRQLQSNEQRIQTMINATTKKITTAANEKELILARIDAERQKLAGYQSSSHQWTTERSLRERKGQEVSSRRAAMEDRLSTARNDEDVALRDLEEAKRRLASARSIRINAESEYRRAVDDECSALTNLRAADDAIASLLADTNDAERRIDEDRRRCDDSLQNIRSALERELVEVEGERLNASRAVMEADGVVEKRRDVVRRELRRGRDQNVANARVALKREARRAEAKAQKLYARAEVLKRRVEEIEEQRRGGVS